MTYAARPSSSTRTPDSTWHATTTLLAVVGIIAAALGAWMGFGPENGTLTILDWTWNVSEVSELWAPLLMIVGGAIAAIPMGIESIRDWGSEHSRWLIAGEALIALIGVAAVIIGITLLF